MQSQQYQPVQGQSLQPMLSQAFNTAGRVDGLPLPIEMIFFLSACVVVAAGVLGLLGVVVTEILAPFDFADCAYLLVFGMIMMILDAPIKGDWIHNYQKGVGKYCKFLTRLTGRGIFFVFLGSMTFATLWNNDIWPVGGFILGPLVFAAGCLGTYLGTKKSRRLSDVRARLVSQKDQIGNLYSAFARASPEEGLAYEEFNNMAGQVAGVQFEKDELALIFGALADGRRAMSYNDLGEWLNGPLTML